MKRFCKFTISFSIVFTLLSSSICSYSFADWTTNIYEEKIEQFIGKGIKHEQILRFTDVGWLNINVLRADISEKDVSLQLLSNEDGMNSRKKLSELVKQDENILGAINGDFFDTKGTSPLGPMVKDGELLSTPFYIPEQLATFNLTKDKEPFISHWTTPYVTLTNNDSQAVLQITAINKETEYNEIAVLYTPKWGANTPPLSKNLPSAIEMVVSNGTVQGIYPASADGNLIPKDGYVIFATGSFATNILNNFVIGNKVTYEIQSSIDYDQLELSLGGGAVLVENGIAKQSFTHEIKGNHPRTALGISQDGKEVILVTIDGRTTSYTGVSQIELAQIMLYLGAYNALNLDGGGSTDMVLRPLGKENNIVVNHLSDGTERRITNGVGISSTAPKTSLLGIELDTSETNVFVNTTRKISVTGYDKNYNPSEINPSAIKWTVSGVTGKVEDGIFAPSSSGNATIEAEYKGIKASINIKVLSEPTSIVVTPNKLNLSTNSQVQLIVKGLDNKGYSASIDSKSVNFEVPYHIGFMDSKGIFNTSSQNSSGIIKASLGELATYIPVVIGTQNMILDDFEKSNGAFTSYPAEVTGTYSLVPFAKEGRYSGEITYDFTTTDATRAAYLAFDNNGIKIDRRPDSIGLWVYGNESGGHGLKMKITDAKGVSENITLVSRINWSGWNYIQAKIPASLTAPLVVERVYVVETNPVIKDLGKIYIDNLTASYPLVFEGTVPNSITKNIDFQNVKAELETDKSFRFFAHGKVSEIDTLGDKLVVTKMSELINEVNSLSVFTENLDPLLGNKIQKPVIVSKSGYSFTKHQDSGFITLDNNNGGLRATNWYQWQWLISTLNQADIQSLFITLPKPLSFKDKLEEKLFKDTLEKLNQEKDIDVWVLYGGTTSYQVKLEDGIHYVALKSFPTEIQYDSIFTQINTMVFTVNGNKVTYEILPLFSK